MNVGRSELKHLREELTALRFRAEQAEARCKRLEEALRQGISLHENGDALTCMCGESVLRHNYQADHPITPMLEYYGSQWAEIARKALEDK